MTLHSPAVAQWDVIGDYISAMFADHDESGLYERPSAYMKWQGKYSAMPFLLWFYKLIHFLSLLSLFRV